MAKQQKTCFIRTRYFVKHTGSVCAKIINGEGKEYTTCLHANGRTSCTCPHQPSAKCPECYHIQHLRASEAQRNTHTEQVDKMPAQPYDDTQRTEKVKKTAVSTQTS